MKKVIFLLFLLVYATTASYAAQTRPKTTSTEQKKKSGKKSSTKQAKKLVEKKTVSRKSSAKKQTDPKRQKQEAEIEQKKLHNRLTTLKKEITRTEVAKDKTTQVLVQSQKAITNTENSLIELGKKKTTTINKLSQLSAEQTHLQEIVTKQQLQLAKLLQQQYISGNQDRMKLLFSGDNPNRISRELQYMNYFSTAYSNLITSLRQNIQAVDNKRAETTAVKKELEKIANKTSEQKNELEKEKVQHAQLLSQLSNKLNSQKKQANRLAQDEKRLAGLVDRLSRSIEEQRKAANKRIAAAEKKQTEQQSRKQSKQSKQEKKSSLPKQEIATVRETPYKVDAASAFGRMRGQLKMPVEGTITARYGTKRADGPSWKGIFIRTAPGAAIKSVAGGRVIFASSLRGFGNLIIVDHGDHYMTIYGNAQSLNRRVGDTVKRGDTIANAGNSGENEETGLYFEIRRSGRAYNPLEWITR